MDSRTGQPMSPITGQHWLYDWIDEHEVSTANAVDDRWRTRTAQDRLYELIGNSERHSVSGVPDSGIAVTGIGFDLGSRVTCGSYKCRTSTANSEFSQIL